MTRIAAARRRLRIPLVLLAGVAAGLPASASGQGLLSPSPHFGAEMYPTIEPTSYVGLNFDRFTRFGKEVDESGNYVWQPYNDIRQTVGLNFIALSATRRVKRYPGTLARLVLQVGYGDNQPTKGAQNYIHDHSNPPLLHVPDSATRSAVDAGLSGDVTRWFEGKRLRFLPAFVGAGASASTAYQEVFAQVGIRPTPWHAGRVALPTPSAMVRGGFTLGGNAFPSHTLERWYGSVQYSLYLPTENWAGFVVRDWVAALVPNIETTLTRDTGFFRGLKGQALREYFISIRGLFFHDTFIFEYWNDTINHKDKGPTGGGRLFLRTRAF